MRAPAAVSPAGIDRRVCGTELACLVSVAKWGAVHAASAESFARRRSKMALSWSWKYKCSILETGTKCEGGSGTFTTTDQQGSGADIYYVVTGITGTVEGNTITSLVAPDTEGNNNDNKLSAPSGSPYANSGHKITGIAFLTNNDPLTQANVNLLFSNFIDDEVGYYTQISGPNGLSLENVAFSSKQE
jgi:hypothetical protein